MQSLRNQIALFLVLLAPFLTSYLIRAVAWQYPLMGRNGAVNQVLQNIGLIDEPLDILGFSRLLGHAALIQLYILFMVTPLFFMLAQVDRSVARGGPRPRRELVQELPRGDPPADDAGDRDRLDLRLRADDGRLRDDTTVGGGQVASVGTIVQNYIVGIQYPIAAASAVFLVLAMMLGVFVLLRFSNLREEL